MDRRRLSIGLMLNISVIAFEALSVATIAPRVARDLGGLDLYGWTFAAFMLANLVSVVLAGHASDRHGPAGPFSIGLVVFMAGLLICGLAPTMPVLIAGRAVQGLGAGALVATAYVAIGRAYDEHERPRQFALLSTAWVIPGLAAPALAGVIAEEAGWRFVFLGLAVLPIIAAWLVLPVMRGLGVGTQLTEGVLPIGAAVRLAAGAGLLVGGLGADRLVVVVPLVLAGLALGIPAYRHLTPDGTRRAMASWGVALVAIGIVFAASALLRDVPVWVAGVAWGIAGLGMGLSYNTASITVLSEADESSQGAAAAALQLSDGLGQALGTGLGGAIVAVAMAGAGGRRDALAVVFGLMFVVALLGIVTARRFPDDPALLSDVVERAEHVEPTERMK
ncbi:MAG: MFS transporter [Acidimicrobiia bacterium]|nr:MFS transporter [Acidimicrobiia bacterium]